MKGPLDGVRVLDLTTWAAAPAACQLLGDWGADVIKIEHPQGGDPARGWMGPGWLPPCPITPGWEADNRNKRGIALDLSKEKGREVAYRLVKWADIFVSNLQESSLKRLNMDYESLKEVNPKLIYAHLTGYGRKGPYREKPGYDYSAFWASSGIMSTIGEPDTPPAFQRPAMGDHMTSLAFVGGILAALFARERHGISQRVDVSLMNTGMWITDWQGQAVLLSGQDIWRVSRRDMPNPMFNIYRAKDGRWFIFTMLFAERFWSLMCKALGIEHIEKDPRFDTVEKRAENKEELLAILDEVVATKTLDEWAPIFDKYELVWAYVHTIKSAIEDPQSEANEFIVELEHPVQGKMRAINSPIRFSETPHSIRNAAPLLGQHTEEVLLELGYSWDDIIKMKEEDVIL
jgi:crotonobetainyl-CoA:carnitine CoA-transferase CaiB-like acyl-CoA transferase